MYKIRQYFSTLEITEGFFIALLGSLFIYMDYLNLYYPLLNTFAALLSLYLLLNASTKTWFWYGSAIGIFWFWWIGLSLTHYGYSYALPFAIFFIGLGYGIIFGSLAWCIDKISSLFNRQTRLVTLMLRAILLLFLSYLHPFSFDWLKPELMFIQSYIGILKWQFFIVLLSFVLMLWRKNILYLLLILLSFELPSQINTNTPSNISLITTHVSVKEKWNKKYHAKQFKHYYALIDKAIEQNKTLIILPESLFPVFINHNEEIFSRLKEKSNKINIVTGGLYWDGKEPRNSTYIFTKTNVTVANKVVLVPFGESNPLPDFLSSWINKIFYDGAVDYVASPNISEYKVNGVTYRNAICFEATSERLYEKNAQKEYPKNMIVISNNGWFTPSIEPTLQKLLLYYYHKKYGTTIYHSINMSKSYVIR